MRASLRIAIFSLPFAAAACGFEAPPPKLTPPPANPAPPVSTLAATVVIPMSAILQALNEKTQTEIANVRNQRVDCTIAACDLDLVATRTGPITGAAEDGRLSLAVPLAATAQLALKSRLFRTNAHALATGTMNTATTIALGPDWKLRTVTQGDIELSQASLKLGPITFGFADIWNRNAARLSSPLFKAIDRQLSSGIKIKPQAERLWLKAQRPIRIGKSPTAWLVLAPECIRVAQPDVQAGVVRLALGVDIRARVVVSDQLPQNGLNAVLPPPATLARPANRFTFVVPVLLPYAQAANLALQRLGKSPIKIGAARLRFEALQILPSGQDVVLAAHFCVSQGWDPTGWFDSCGEGYLRGKPVFDAKSGTIRIVDVRYDVATEGLILRAMRMLAGDALGKALETKLVYGVAQDIQKLDGELRAALAKPQGRGVILSGTVEKFGAPALTWTKDGFLASFPAEGTIHADLYPKAGSFDRM